MSQLWSGWKLKLKVNDIPLEATPNYANRWTNVRATRQYQSVGQARNIAGQTAFGECEYFTFLIYIEKSCLRVSVCLSMRACVCVCGVYVSRFDRDTSNWAKIIFSFVAEYVNVESRFSTVNDVLNRWLTVLFLVSGSCFDVD